MDTWFLKVASVGATATGVYLLWVGGRSATTGGVLLLVVALASSGVLFGGGRYGPRVEGPLDLSARLALGLLGGILGALASAAAARALGAAGIPALLGVEMSGYLSAADFLRHLGGGAIWGTVFGVVLPAVPGRSLSARAAAFSLVPSLYVLLKVFPLDRDLGLFGVELGALAFLFVVLYNLVWALVTVSLFGWGGGTELAPISEPLGSTGDATRRAGTAG